PPKGPNPRGPPLHDPPEGSYPDDPIRRCSPCKGLAIHGRLRYVLNRPDSAEPIKPPLLDH
ncbi:MAG: hypothetical protein ACKVJN_01630, partial [Woeseiales bacterium]